MTGASPVTTIHESMASHVVASRHIVVTGLAPVMPPTICFALVKSIKGSCI